jgi:hypothetical protein
VIAVFSIFAGEFAPFKRFPDQQLFLDFQSRFAAHSDPEAAHSGRYHIFLDFRTCFAPFSRYSGRFHGHHLSRRQHVSKAAVGEGRWSSRFSNAFAGFFQRLDTSFPAPIFSAELIRQSASVALPFVRSRCFIFCLGTQSS